MQARYFFIKDKIKSGEVFVEYCPTEMMWADVLNKPKQGRPFRLHRSFLMNVRVDYNNTEELLQTHGDLLPDGDRTLKKVILLRQRLQAQPCHRSVLRDNTNCQAGAPRAKTYSDIVHGTYRGFQRGGSHLSLPMMRRTAPLPARVMAPCCHFLLGSSPSMLKDC